MILDLYLQATCLIRVRAPTKHIIYINKQYINTDFKYLCAYIKHYTSVQIYFVY